LWQTSLRRGGGPVLHPSDNERLGVDQRTISLDTKNCHLAKIGKDLGPEWNDKGLAEWAKRSGIGLTDACAPLPLN